MDWYLDPARRQFGECPLVNRILKTPSGVTPHELAETLGELRLIGFLFDRVSIKTFGDTSRSAATPLAVLRATTNRRWVRIRNRLMTGEQGTLRLSTPWRAATGTSRPISGSKQRVSTSPQSASVG